MACYVLTMNNCGKLQEVSNEGVDWMFPHFQSFKYSRVTFAINKMLWGCVGNVGVFKGSDVVGTPIHRGSADDMVTNPTLDVFSDITCYGYNFQI